MWNDVVLEVVPRQLEGKRDQRERSAVEGLDPYTQIVGGFKLASRVV
jgi:hypothetical protein